GFVSLDLQHGAAEFETRIGYRQHAQRVTEVVDEFARARRTFVGADDHRPLRLEPARIDVVDRGAGQGRTGVAVLIDAVADNGWQMLIAGNVKRERPADFAQGRVPRRLRPAVGVVVGTQYFTPRAVSGGHRGEGG